MDKKSIDSKSAGVRNEKLILALLRQHTQLSQAQICEMANLGSSTVCYIVSRLREKGLVVEKKGKSTKRGAKPVSVSINPCGQFIVGIEINPDNILIGLFDFNCRLMETTQVLLSDDRSPKNICNTLEINLRGLLGKHHIEHKKLSGIGAVLSGSISKDGIVELSSPLGWKSVPLRQMLINRLKVPVMVCTTRVRLLAENSQAHDLHYKNVLSFNIADGVGSHAIIDGHLLHGSTSRSGEIGHIIVDPDGPECGCGHKGCLESFISGPALAKMIRGDIEKGCRTILKDTVVTDDFPETVISKWGQAIESKDDYSLKLCEFVAEHFSRIAAIAINCYDPDIVVLAGYVSKQCFESLAQSIRKRIATDVYDSDSRDIQIKAARFGREALVIGVAKTAFQQFLA